VVEEASFQSCERLSLGERVRRGSENSWKGSCSYHRAKIILVWPIAEAQGNVGLAIEELSCVTVKVYTPRVGHPCGE
jgi:hypothetical protein